VIDPGIYTGYTLRRHRWAFAVKYQRQAIFLIRHVFYSSFPHASLSLYRSSHVGTIPFLISIHLLEFLFLPAKREGDSTAVGQSEFHMRREIDLNRQLGVVAASTGSLQSSMLLVDTAVVK
jgi:hypothetical protein